MNKRETIINNYEKPFKRGLIEDDSYVKTKTKNINCIDEIDIMVKINNNKIEDILFDGEACMVSIASTSILFKLLINKTQQEAQNIISNYENMINQKEYDKKAIGDLVVFEDIYLQPNRKTCALLAVEGLKKII